MNPLVLLVHALIDPRAATRDAAREPRPVLLGLCAIGIISLLGLATLPRQLHLLSVALAPTGDLLRDMHHAALRGGLERVVIIDRLVTPPTAVLTWVILVAAAEPVLSLARDRRRAVWAVLLLGLAPLMVQRLGELVVTYLVSPGSPPSPGEAIDLPHRFTTGALLVWPSGKAPRWVASVSQRLNLMTLWSVGCWTVGLRELDGGRRAAWHLALALGSLLLAALATWWFAPLVMSVVLGRP